MRRRGRADRVLAKRVGVVDLNFRTVQQRRGYGDEQPGRWAAHIPRESARGRDLRRGGTGGARYADAAGTKSDARAAAGGDELFVYGGSRFGTGSLSPPYGRAPSRPRIAVMH